MKVSFRSLPHAAGLAPIAYASANAAGLDLRAAVQEPVTLGAGERALIQTGLLMAIPEGFEGQVRPRSGLAAKHGVTVLNSPGTIDADYRGEVKVILINLGSEPFTVERGDRIAQLVIAPVVTVEVDYAEFSEADDGWQSTGRSSGGFGSTGRN
jgi:dUTP pyrophosphatase